MTDEQSETARTRRSPRTPGSATETSRLAGIPARAGDAAAIERAVDEGYPVPFSVDERGRDGHQLMVIGHSGDQLQVYNPWGYTYWITEREFVDGPRRQHRPGDPVASPSRPAARDRHGR